MCGGSTEKMKKMEQQFFYWLWREDYCIGNDRYCLSRNRSCSWRTDIAYAIMLIESVCM